jgi:hypothetical protein
MKAALESVQTAPRRPVISRPAPDKQALQSALRSALQSIDTPAGAPAAPGAAAAGAAAPRRARLLIAAGLVVAALLLGGAAAWFAADFLPDEAAPVVAAVDTTRPRLRVGDADRAPATQAMNALKGLQSVSRVDVPFRVYFNRVALARSDADRAIQAIRDPEVRAPLFQALALHGLAAAAWKTRTLDERDRWEAVASDPGVELCGPVKRLLAVPDEPAGMARGQWRGMTVAASIPLLWDCAAERLAAVEQALK